MYSPNELEKFSMLFDEPMKQLENQIMADIIRRIKINGEITRAADWQIYRLHELGMSKREIKKAIKDALNLSPQEVNHLFKDVIRKGYAEDEKIYKYKGKPFIPFEDNKQLQQLITAVAAQAHTELKNITQSLGFAVKQPDGTLKFTKLADYYQRTLDNATLSIATGAFDYNTVLQRTVAELTNSGLRTVDYASGHSNRVDVAVRRAVMTGVNQVVAKVNDDNAEKLGTEYFEVSWHGGARPTHQVWQGRVYSKKELETVCGLGTVTGLCGANCYHSYSPFFPGISERIYTDKQLEEMNRKDNTPVEYNGKQYTKYEASQRQRRLETTMRAQRQKIKLLQEGGADEDDIITARGRYRVTSAEYTRFSKAMDLPQQRERVTVDGLGNIGVGKYKKTIAKSAENGIINLNNKGTVVNDVHKIGNIDINKYKCVTEDIKTSDVIITDERIQHIKDRHPNDYEKYYRYMSEVVANPDYIVEANKPNTALILKAFSENGEQFKTVLRLITSSDDCNFKNSIITFMKINEKEWQRLLRNKKILYKLE